MPAFQAEVRIERAIASVAAQTLTAWELVIVDDASTDRTRTIVQDLARCDERIKLFEMKENSGPAKARSHGCQVARGRYITTLDSDDIYISPRKLEAELAIVQAEEAKGNTVVAFSKHLHVRSTDRIKLDKSFFRRPKSGNLLWEILTRSTVIPRDMLLSRDLYEAVGGFDSKILMYEDWDLKIRLAARAAFIYSGVRGTGYFREEQSRKNVSQSLSMRSFGEHRSWLGHVFRKNIHLLETTKQKSAAETLERRMFAMDSISLSQDGMDLDPAEILGENIIFLISMPRSGSTMTQRLIMSHPDIASASEPWLLFAPAFADKSVGWMPYNTHIAANALEDVVEHLPGKREAYLRCLRECYSRIYAMLRGADKKYFLDKTPRYHLILDEIAELFPRARFVCVHRHPFAVLNSMLEEIEFDETRLPHWRADLLTGMKNLHAFQPGASRKISLRYEDILADTKGEMKRVFQFLKLDPERADVENALAKRQQAWKLGDQKTAWSTKTVQSSRADAWRASLEENSLLAELAPGYLDYLGQKLVNDCGYDFEAARNHAEMTATLDRFDELINSTDAVFEMTKASQSPMVAVAARLANMLGPQVYLPAKKFYRKFKGRN
ncbi:sulfotransferase [Marivita geojedonensis]|uniref:sulfotransferase n=1 Tax=Marivita geojedonensis TaxID=1123756 RepID=UPI000D4DFF2E|nr:sulfotransferase [Marivita geojedonensis]PRY74214.1 glycosyl transferase family 2 [Marivita geojedonensis]